MVAPLRTSRTHRRPGERGTNNAVQLVQIEWLGQDTDLLLGKQRLLLSEPLSVPRQNDDRDGSSVLIVQYLRQHVSSAYGRRETKIEQDDIRMVMPYACDPRRTIGIERYLPPFIREDFLE